jgi:hypothetical protein
MTLPSRDRAKSKQPRRRREGRDLKSNRRGRDEDRKLRGPSATARRATITPVRSHAKPTIQRSHRARRCSCSMGTATRARCPRLPLVGRSTGPARISGRGTRVAPRQSRDLSVGRLFGCGADGIGVKRRDYYSLWRWR